ncbi:MAG: hypothetical protein ACLQVG_07675 [Terriglobia bacterium]
MLQADLEELRQQVRDLTTRISRLEESLAPRENLIPSREAEPPTLPDGMGSLSQVSDTTSALPVLGTALLGLAGAYLLRAIAESGVLPPRAVFTLGTLYAVAWLLWAARAPVERRLSTTLYSLASVLILSPLLCEATLRFHMITTWEASTVLVAFTLIGLAVSWRRDLLVVATISTLAGLGTAGALLIATHDAMPFTWVFLAIAAAVEACACLNHWLGERWLAAAAANLSVLLATWLLTNPYGLPDVYAPISTHALFAAQMALLAIYLSSVIVRTLLRGLTFTTFETGQCALAFAIGLGGAMRLSAGNPHMTPAIGVFALVCGAACYAISFVMLERHGSHGRNFYTYSTFGILLVLVGCRMLLTDGAAGIVWSMLAVACIAAGGRWARLTLEIHGGIYLALALAVSGALQQSAGFLLGSEFWLDSAHAALWMGVAVAGASYLLAVRFAPSIGDSRSLRTFRLALASVLVWEVLGLSAGGLTRIYHGLTGMPAGDPYCATVRTGVVTGAALLLALIGSRSKFSHLAQLVYPLMLLGAYRLVAVDMHQDRKVALFLSLLIYGAALMTIPRLRRARLNS